MRYAVIVFTLASAMLVGSPVHRDWRKYPAIVQMDTTGDIYAVSDPHADYARLATLLNAAGLIGGVPQQPEKVTWTAGKSVLVFSGDLIDKGQNSLGVLSLARALRIAAASAGGTVIILAGNHEAEFLATPNAEKVAEFAAELKKAGLDPVAVAACKGDLGEFLCSLSFGARVNDWFFSHAGNTSGRSMQKLIADIQAGVDKDGYATQQLIGPDSLLEARLGNSPWFERQGADGQKTLAADASALGVAHIVQGHQPGHVLFADQTKRKAGQIFQRWGLIFLVDTGMSEGVDDSKGGLLFIASGKHHASAVCYDGTMTKVWDRQEKAELGKAAVCGAE